VIVTSLAGGTGSGMFIDTAYMIRDILKRPDYMGLLGKSITLIAYLPEMFGDKPAELPKKRQNAYAAMLELEYYGTPRTGDELFVGTFRGQAAEVRNARFSAMWDGVTKTEFDGPGWDTCFLIDNINNLNPTSPMSLDEIYQMTADYLFIDFEQHQFATKKRSTRANLVQFMERRKETWVKRPAPDDNNGQANAFDANDVIYATQNGCRYSSFGLAEVYFDVERLYQAAGYRLASHLIRRWLRKPPGDLKLKEWAEEDLLSPKVSDEQTTPPPSFRFESLMDLMYTREGVNARSVAKKRLAELKDKPPAAGLSLLLNEINEHDKLLRKGSSGTKGGRARSTLIENRGPLEGGALDLGLLRERVRIAAANRFARYGVEAVLELLKHYRVTLDAERAKAIAAAGGTLKSPAKILARLEECNLVPTAFRKMAQGIEYTEAHQQTSARVETAYQKAAADEVEPLYPGIAKYIGAANQADDPSLNRHRTLYERYSKIKKHLKNMEEFLDNRFKISSLDDGHHETRRFSLSLGWDGEVYDKRIKTALVVNPNVGEVSPGKGDFDWRKLENAVLQRLREHEGLEGVRDLAGLFDFWIGGLLANQAGIAEVSELIAEVCRFVIRRTDRSGGLPFEENEGAGNIVDYLAIRTDLQSKIDNMVKASAVYFPTIPGNMIATNFTPAYFNLYAQKSSEHLQNRQRNNQTVATAVRTMTQNRGERDGSGHLPNEVLESDVSSLVLAREMTGFPLQFYSRLDELKRYYDTNVPITRSKDECHIDYREASDDLPDITNLSIDTYTKIRRTIGFVLQGMLTEVINWRRGMFHIRMPDAFHTDFVDVTLGSRLNRAVKTACEHPTIPNYLQECWTNWLRDATDRHLAILYVSCRKTHRELQPTVNAAVRQVQYSPLRNCFEEIIKEAERLLNRTEDGQQWLQAVAPKLTGPHDSTPVLVSEDSLASKIERNCLHRMSDDLPIYQIVRNRMNHEEIVLPTVPAQVSR
jgi:hypothetical protein